MAENLDFDQENINEVSPIPSFLKVLCILSFVFLGFSLLSSIASIVHGKFTEQEMLNDKERMSKELLEFEKIDFQYGIDMTKQLMSLKEILNNNSFSVSLVSLIICCVGIFGVMKMRSGFKIGFHLYIIYSLLYATQNYFFASVQYIPSLIVFLNLFISFVFILMYSRNLKWMK